MRKLLIFIIFFSSLFSAQSQMHNQPFNLDFEIGVPGEFPFGWMMSKYATGKGYKAVVTAQEPMTGRYCLELSNDNKGANIQGDIIQSIDAQAYRGKNIRVRAAIRAKFKSSSWANVWFRTKIDRQNVLTKVTTDETLNITDEWQYAVIEGRVDESAYAIDLGVELEGYGTVWIDDVAIEIIYDETKFEPAREISTTELSNLEALAHSLGAVRYFYSGFEAGFVNWEDFTYNMVKATKDIESKDELKEVLNSKFQNIAPLFSVSEEKDKPSVKESFPNAMDSIAIALRYDGPFTGLAEDLSERKLINLYRSQRDLDGIMIQQFNSEDLHGQKIRYTAYVKADVEAPAGRAHLYLSSKTKYHDNQPVTVINSEPIIKNEWTEYSIDFEVPKNSEVIVFGMILMGDGKAWLDDVHITFPGTDAEVDIPNFDFETVTEGKMHNWYIPEQSMEAGYFTAYSDGDAKEGNGSGLIYSDQLSKINLPEIGEIYSVLLGNGLKAEMPLSLQVDSMRTLPYSKSDEFNTYQRQKLEFALNANDRNSRLAIAIMLWNRIVNFSMYEIDDKDSRAMLSKLLSGAAEAENYDSFVNLLNEFLVETGDPLALAWKMGGVQYFSLPFSIFESNGKYYVKSAGNNNDIKNGDEILAINGKKIIDLVSEEAGKLADPNPRVKLEKALAKIRTGEDGEEVEITFASKGERKEINLRYNTPMSQFQEYRPPKMFEIEKGIFYVDLSRVSYDDIKQLGRIVEKGYRGIIFDARGKIHINDYFLGMMVREITPSYMLSLPVFTSPDGDEYSQKVRRLNLKPKNPHLGERVFFLADYRSSNLADAILYLVKHYNLGTIVGGESAGTYREHFTFNLPGELSCTVSGMKFLSVEGNDMYGQPVVPDIPVDYSREDIIQEKDKSLDKAIELIVNKN
jgi:hypothetical protein